jgi:hypothetical protein
VEYDSFVRINLRLDSRRLRKQRVVRLYYGIYRYYAQSDKLHVSPSRQTVYVTPLRLFAVSRFSVRAEQEVNNTRNLSTRNTNRTMLEQ